MYKKQGLEEQLAVSWFLRVPWTERTSNQSILKEINPEYSLEGWCWSWSSNSSGTWCEEPTHWKRPWSWESLKATAEEGAEEEMVRWHHWLRERESKQTPGDSGGPRSLCAAVYGAAKGRTGFSDWTTAKQLVREMKMVKSVSDGEKCLWEDLGTKETKEATEIGDEV